MFVKAERVNDLLVVDDALRIYPEEFDVSVFDEPTSILAKFLERFGIDGHVYVTADGTRSHVLGPTKLIQNYVARLPTGGKVATEFGDTGLEFEAELANEPIEIAFAYSINFNAYAADLARHGVKTVPAPGRYITVHNRNRAAFLRA